MRWAPVVEKPEREGQYYCWSDRLGRVVMGYVDGSWGAQPPTYWLQADTCKPQGPGENCEDCGYLVGQGHDPHCVSRHLSPMAHKAYPIEDEL